MISILSLLITVVILCYLAYSEKRKFRFLRTLPGPRTLPFFGSLCFITSTTIKFSDLIMRCTNQYGRRYCMAMGSEVMVVLSDPKDVTEVLNNAMNKSVFYDFLKPWLGNGLLISDASTWKSNRKFLNAAYHFRILESHLPLFDEGADTLAEVIRATPRGTSLDVYPHVSSFTLQAIIDAATGTQFDKNKKENIDYLNAIKILLGIIDVRCTQVFLQFEFVFKLSKYNTIQSDALNTVVTFTNNVIRERRKELKNQQMPSTASEDDILIGAKRKLSFLDLMILSNERIFSDQEIKDELETIFFGGHDTTSSAISFSLYAISRDSNIQERLYNEQVSIFGYDKSRLSTNSDLQEMKYLEMTIKEAMRRYTIVPLISRRLDEDATINGLFIPKNTIAITNIKGMCLDPEVFPNPFEFNPERFSTEESKERHPWNYIPFSAGPRNCIGHKYAMMQMKCVLSKILRNFKLSPGSRELEISGDIVSKPKSGVNVVFEERH